MLNLASDAAPQQEVVEGQRRISVRVGLLLAFALISTLVVAASATGLTALYIIAGKQDRITDEAVPAAIAAESLYRGTTKLGSAILALDQVDNEESLKQNRSRVARSSARIGQQMERLLDITGNRSMTQPVESVVLDLVRLIDSYTEATANRLALEDEKRRTLDNAMSLARKLADVTDALVANARVGVSSPLSALYDIVEDPEKIDQVFETIDDVLDVDLFYSEQMNNLKIDSLTLPQHLLALTKSTGIDEMQGAQRLIQANLKKLKRSIAFIVDPHRKKQAELVLASLSDLLIPETGHDLFGLLAANLENVVERAELKDASVEAFARLDHMVSEIADVHLLEISDARQGADDTSFLAQLAMVVLSVSGVLVAVIIGYVYVQRDILRRLTALSDATRELAGGNIDVAIPPAKHDELGDMARALAVFRSNARELQTALKKERELNGLQRQFVSMVSHEFRTPLAIIDGSAQQLLRKSDNIPQDRLTNRLAKIRVSVRRLTDLMESVLGASRLEEGRIKFDPAECDLNIIVSEVCDNYIELNPEYTLIRDLDGQIQNIFADEKLLRQVASNLLSNAIKYSETGSRVWIGTRCSSDGEVVLSVRDEGVGIPEHEQKQMFARFFRASTSTGIAGSGIGLHLAQHLAALHGGKILFESVEGKGTTFFLRLPVEPTTTQCTEGTGDPVVDGDMERAAAEQTHAA